MYIHNGFWIMVAFELKCPKVFALQHVDSKTKHSDLPKMAWNATIKAKTFNSNFQTCMWWPKMIKLRVWLCLRWPKVFECPKMFKADVQMCPQWPNMSECTHAGPKWLNQMFIRACNDQKWLNWMLECCYDAPVIARNVQTRCSIWCPKMIEMNIWMLL